MPQNRADSTGLASAGRWHPARLCRTSGPASKGPTRPVYRPQAGSPQCVNWHITCLESIGRWWPGMCGWPLASVSRLSHHQLM